MDVIQAAPDHCRAGRLTSYLLLQLSGSITYNGERFDQFYPQRTAVYVDQVRCLSSSPTMICMTFESTVIMHPMPLQMLPTGKLQA